VLEPITGPAASLGKLQNDWIQFYVNGYNKTHKKGKLRLAKGDTVLGGPGGTAEAVRRRSRSPRTFSESSARPAATRSRRPRQH